MQIGSMKASKGYLIIVCAAILGSCQGALSQKELVSWVHDYENGLHQKKAVGDYIFDVQAKPVEYLRVVQSAKMNVDSSHSSLQYYDLKIQLKDGKTDLLKYKVTDEKNYYEKLYYFSYHFQQDIYVEQGGKKLPCALFHFERSYDLSPIRTFVLAFEKSPQKDQGSTLVINAKWLETGPVKIYFEDIKIPKIKN